MGAYEPKQITYLFKQAHARGCDVFLDVGANIGYYSMVAAKMRQFKEIHAIEPSRGNFERLQWHILKNGFDTVRAHQTAITDFCGKIRISKEHTHNVTVISVVDSNADGVEADCATLDSLFNFHGRGLAIKMDIEGHEVPAVRGATRLFAENDILLQVEILPENSDTIKYLLSQGFEIINHYENDFYFTRKR